MQVPDRGRHGGSEPAVRGLLAGMGGASAGPAIPSCRNETEKRGTPMLLMHVARAVTQSPFAAETLTTLALGVAMCWLAMVVHELGHALAALILGVRIWGINL